MAASNHGRQQLTTRHSKICFMVVATATSSSTPRSAARQRSMSLRSRAAGAERNQRNVLVQSQGQRPSKPHGSRLQGSTCSGIWPESVQRMWKLSPARLTGALGSRPESCRPHTPTLATGPWSAAPPARTRGRQEWLGWRWPQQRDTALHASAVPGTSSCPLRPHSCHTAPQPRADATALQPPATRQPASPPGSSRQGSTHRRLHQRVAEEGSHRLAGRLVGQDIDQVLRLRQAQ